MFSHAQVSLTPDIQGVMLGVAVELCLSLTSLISYKDDEFFFSKARNIFRYQSVVVFSPYILKLPVQPLLL